MSHTIRLFESTLGGNSLSNRRISAAEVVLCRDCSSESENNAAKSPMSWKCVVLGLPSEMSSEDFMLFLEPYASEISAVEIIADQANINHSNALDTVGRVSAGQTGSCSVLPIPSDRNTLQNMNCISKMAIVQFFKEVSLREFSNLYNNLHFPNFKNVPPCIVIPLKSCEYIQQETKNATVLDFADDDNNCANINFQPLMDDNEKISENLTNMNNFNVNQNDTSNNDNDNYESKDKIRNVDGPTIESCIHLKGEERDPRVLPPFIDPRVLPPFCIELPTCTVCLRRLQCSASGVDGGNDIPVSMWFSGNVSRCRVCKVYGEGTEGASSEMSSSSTSTSSSSSSSNSQLRHCMSCGLTGNIWACLVCAHTGCGRYAMRHAEQHYRETQHSFSLELATGRIWDYKEDNFVHVEGDWGRWIENEGISRPHENRHENGNENQNGNRNENILSGQINTPSANAASTSTSSQQDSSPGRNSSESKSFNNNSSNFHENVDKNFKSGSGSEKKNPKNQNLNDEISHFYSSEEYNYMNMTQGSGFRGQGRNVDPQLDGVILDKMGVLLEGYENLLECQLLDQQIYFEKKLARETIQALEDSMRRGRGRENDSDAHSNATTHATSSSSSSSSSSSNSVAVKNIPQIRCDSVDESGIGDDKYHHGNNFDNGNNSSTAYNDSCNGHNNTNNNDNLHYLDNRGNVTDDNDYANRNNYDNYDDQEVGNRERLELYRERGENSGSPGMYGKVEAVDAVLAEIELKKMEISSIESDYFSTLSLLKEIETQSRAVRKQNEILIREQKILRDRVQELNHSEEIIKRKCEEEVSELEQQIRDLCFYTKMKNQVASSPLKAELEGGSVVVPVTVNERANNEIKKKSPAHNKKQK